MGTSLQRKVFIIVSLILVYLMVIAPFINYLINVNFYVNDIWWYYIELGVVILLFIYWYAIREIDEEKMDENLINEIEKIKKEYGVVFEKLSAKQEKESKKGKKDNSA